LKKSSDPRHLQRVSKIQQLFAWDFAHGSKSPQEMDFSSIEPITKRIKTIDNQIEKAAPMWAIPKINKIDLAVLRNATYELLIDKKIPPKVIIDEAIEIAKELGAEASPAFVNGALGKMIQNNRVTT
jgi:transcription antitermination factor NusB